MILLLFCALLQAQTERWPIPGAIMPEPLRINASNWHNADFPAIDWTPAGRDRWYADPVTGVRLRPILRPEDFSWSDKSDRTFIHQTGTNPLYLYPAVVDPWQTAPMAVLNIGLVGSCPGCTACISYQPGECAGTVVKLDGPRSTHKYGGNAVPAEYPRPLFAGWGNVRIERDRAIPLTPGTSSRVVNGVLTIDTPAHTNPGHIPRTLRAGHRIWVQDSPCPDQLCTVELNRNAGEVVLREKFSSEKKQFRPLPWAIMVRGATAGVTFKYRAAGQVNSSTGTYAPVCGAVEVTDANGVKGHPCGIPERGGPKYDLYFIANDGSVVRPIAAFIAPTEVGPFRGESLSFSAGDARMMYVKNASQIYRLTYTGDWTHSRWDSEELRYYINPGGDFPYVDEGMKWEVAINPDAAVQITEKYPKEVSAPYRPWTPASFAGVTGDLAVIFRTANGGQDDGPCQVAVFNLVTGKIIDLINTIEGSGPVAWGNCHSVGINPLVDNTLKLSLNIMQVKNPAKISGGPFQMKVEAIQRGGQWSSNTCLEWPPVTGTQCAGLQQYDKACPAGLSSEYTDFGATGDACVTMLMTGNPCNTVPSPGDTQIYGACAWNPAWSGAPALRPGHSFVDVVTGGSAPGDAEHFRVLTVQNVQGKVKVVAQRNASRDYCCGNQGTTSNPTGNNCVCNPTQMSHKDQWQALMTPGSKAACNSASIHVTYSKVQGSPQKTYTELSRSLQGHSAYGRGPNGTLRYLAPGGVTTLASFADLGQQPPKKLSTALVKFNGINAAIGSYSQQYLNHSQSQAGDEGTVYSFDANAVNPGVGIAGNEPGNGIGPRKLYQQVSGDVWKMTAVDAVDYKRRPLLGWAGPKVLKDVSAPKSNISAAGDYTFCHAYKAGECYTGSAQGDIYTKVPLTYKYSDLCQTGMEFANVPCVLSAAPAAGYTRQFRSDRADIEGSDQRLVTSALRPYGTHYPYWSITAHPSANVALVPTGGMLEGILHSVLLAELPEWQDVQPRRNQFGGMTVSLGPAAGKTKARVRFGYTPDYRCTDRAEACLTDAAVVPFAFAESDTLTPHECAGGCEIVIPAWPGRELYYEVERLP